MMGNAVPGKKTMAEPKVFIYGRIERREFEEPFRQCTEMLENIGAWYCANPAVVEDRVDFALFFQSYPHEFSRLELKQLRRTNPFASFFFVLGTCCEGMLRTAGLLDSPFYTYVHGWSGREPEQIRLFLIDQPSIFSLPQTAGNDEIAQWLHQAACHPPSAVCRQPSLILTHFGPFGNDSAMNRLLADEQERLGNDPVFSGKMLPESFSGRILADSDNSPREKILESIQRIRHRFADNEFTVYVDSPRIDEKNGYLRAGATQVLPKIR